MHAKIQNNTDDASSGLEQFLTHVCDSYFKFRSLIVSTFLVLYWFNWSHKWGEIMFLGPYQRIVDPTARSQNQLSTLSAALFVNNSKLLQVDASYNMITLISSGTFGATAGPHGTVSSHVHWIVLCM